MAKIGMCILKSDTAFPEIAIINFTFWLDIWLKIATINACNDL